MTFPALEGDPWGPSISHSLKLGVSSLHFRYVFQPSLSFYPFLLCLIQLFAENDYSSKQQAREGGPCLALVIGTEYTCRGADEGIFVTFFLRNIE